MALAADSLEPCSVVRFTREALKTVSSLNGTRLFTLYIFPNVFAYGFEMFTYIYVYVCLYM